MTRQTDNTNDPKGPEPPPRDELDALLRVWHDQNADRAAARLDRVMRALHEESLCQADGLDSDSQTGRFNARKRSPSTRRHLIRSLVMNRYSPLAAAVIIIAIAIPFIWPHAEQTTFAETFFMTPEAGRLDAIDEEGNIVGPCALRHTDVNAEISGHFVRVTVNQKYYNPYPDKIEARYTFPLSHRAAVDRMNMTIGDRVVVGEVHERTIARAIYEAARKRGYVASLLEQERPNIFTQSVANIESGVEVDIEISYVEMIEPRDGTYSFEFPMVVGPRYIPGAPKAQPVPLPANYISRHGVIELSPADIIIIKPGSIDELGTLSPEQLAELLHGATPIKRPRWTDPNRRQSTDESIDENTPAVWYDFEAAYGNGSKEIGVLYANHTGQINGRWFYVGTPAPADRAGDNFAPDTDQVPDASRITPMPVPPDRRAGHDISVSVTIDTGGPGIKDLKSALHEIVRTASQSDADGRPRRVSVKLAKASEIPNRDFVLTWQQTANAIEEATFAHSGDLGKFFTLIIAPPDRVDDVMAVPREIIFVLDVSGSMKGFPIEKAKATMAKIIDTLRPQDTFNIITFANGTNILWDKPRPFNAVNHTEAQQFLSTRTGGGGTEMMKAIDAALKQDTCSAPDYLTLEKLGNLPADGRQITVYFNWADREVGKLSLPYAVDSNRNPLSIRLLDGGGSIEMHIPQADLSKERRNYRNACRVTGKWVTKHGHAMLIVDSVEWLDVPPAAPVRFCCFMTDGKVGNDMAIIDAVKKNADTTRVFSFGIGNSVNRYLLDSMAIAGRGAVEYVLLEDQADAAVERFATRIQTPVLTNIELDFSDNLQITNQTPRLVPDLFDRKPIIIHGQYDTPGKGTLTIRGKSGEGRYERTINLELPESQPEHDSIATCWARTQVEQLMNENLKAVQEGKYPEELKQEIIRIGEQFNIMTQFTSFVAVEKARVTIGGEPRLVTIPIELPAGTAWEGFFGPCRKPTELFAKDDADTIRKMLESAVPIEREIEIRHAKASEITESLNRILERSRYQSSVTLVPDADGKSLIFSAPPAIANELEELTKTLDVASDKGETSVRTYALDYADLATVGEIISAKFGQPASQPADGSLTLTPVAEAKSMIIRATPAQHEEVSRIVRELEAASVTGMTVAQTIKVDNMTASELADTLNQIVRSGKRRDRATAQYPVTVTANDATGEVLIAGNEREVTEARQLLQTLDAPADGGTAAPPVAVRVKPGARSVLSDAARSESKQSGTPITLEARGLGSAGDSADGALPGLILTDIAAKPEDLSLEASGFSGQIVNGQYEPYEVGVSLPDADFMGPLADRALSFEHARVHGYARYESQRGSNVGDLVIGDGQTGGYGGYGGRYGGGYGMGVAPMTGWDGFAENRPYYFNWSVQGGVAVSPDGRTPAASHWFSDRLSDIVDLELNAATQPAAALDGEDWGDTRELYEVKGDPKETADRLDKILYALHGMEAPIAEAFPHGNQIVISGSPEHFESARQWLEKLETGSVDDDTIEKLVASSSSGHRPPRATTRPVYQLQNQPPFFCERTALAVARLVTAGQIDEARKLADLLATFAPDYAVGVQMRDTLADESLAPADRDKRIAELAAQAAEPIQALIRQAKLQQRVDPQLLQLINNKDARPEDLGITVGDAGLRITVLASDLDDATLAAFKQAGLAVESTAPTMKLIVGTTKPETLADVALIDQVKKIEPARLN